MKRRREPESTPVETSPLPVYESRPPPWLPKVHKFGDLGYLGFHPPRSGQDEDVLSEPNVKNGFVADHPVSAESFTAQAIVKINDDSLSKLEELMTAVFARRAEHLPSIPPSTFRLPSRVTLTDAKRQAWFTDLANSNVPLYKLGKSVPHGVKGHDLLDLLHSNNVAIPRAIWLLRVLGANETAGLRNKPSYNPTFYSIEWTGVMTSYMKKQLLDIALPSAPRHGMNMNIKQNFKGVLAETDSRERWISRFSYCLRLLRRFYSEGLVDHRTFLTWLVQQMSTCNLAQAGFISRLADEYLEGMLCSRPLTHHFAESCLSRLSEMRGSVPQQYLANTETLLRSLLQRICLTIPDAFISPRMWINHSDLLQYALVENVLDSFADQRVEQTAHGIRQLLASNFNDIKRRNEAMLFCNPPPRALAGLGSAVTEVQLLNSISNTTDIKSLDFFTLDTPHDPAFSDKLDRLITWSVSPHQFGEHRPFAAVTLIREWRDHVVERAHRRHFTPPGEFLQDHLFDWLDSSKLAGDETNIRAVALIFGKLVKHELFSYSEYMQRLIARGESGLLSTDDPPSRHRNFLRWIPIYSSDPSLSSQRKVILYGTRVRETPECIKEREMRMEIRALLPELFGAELSAPPLSTHELLQKCPTLISASRVEQTRTFKQWLMPILRKTITSQSNEISAQPVLYKSYCLAVELMTHAQCFHTILDLTTIVLSNHTNLDLLRASIDTLQRFHLIWISLDVMRNICTALHSAHLFWKAQGIQSRKLLDVLIRFDDARYLDPSAREQVVADITNYTLALQPEVAPGALPVPDLIQEILHLNSASPDAPSILANGLWFKYRSSHDWGYKAWDTTVTAIRQSNIQDPLARQTFSLNYGEFLHHVDHHLPHGLDDDVLRWFHGSGKLLMVDLNASAWDSLITVLLHLSVHGSLRATTIFEGLILPVWQSVVQAASPEEQELLSALLLASHSLFERLMFSESASDDMSPPSNLLEIQCIRTRREELYLSPQFSSLLSSVPILLSLENSSHVPEEVKNRTALIRVSLCEQQSFRQGVYRNLDAIRETFEQSILPGGICENFAEQIAEALQDALCITRDSNTKIHPDIALLSPWKLAATAIQMKLILRQMGRTTFSETTRQSAKHDLDRLIKAIFHHAVSPEQACVMADMAKGADPEVVSEFMHNGVQTLSTVLNSRGSSADGLEDKSRRAGEVLRVLSYIAEPFRKEGIPLPQIDQEAYDKLFGAIKNSITSLAAELSSGSEGLISPTSTNWAILLARLLQFLLGFHGQCSANVKALSNEASSGLLTLLLLHISGQNLNVVAYVLLLDTLYYLLDEVAIDAKSVTFDPCFNYPDMQPSEIPAGLPSEYRMQLARLMSHFPPNTAVENLALAHRDAGGALVIDGPVLNRPWEWTENLGEPPLLDPKEEAKEQEERDRLGTKYLIKNSSSLSLENFAARVTGDGILHGDSSKIQANLRTFEDGLSGENMFCRDWRESRVGCDLDTLVGTRSRPEGEHELSGGGGASLSQIRRSIPRASPTASVLSRSSAHASSVRHHSPSQISINRLSASSVSETIEVESSSSSKRKPSGGSDDEIEIVQGPVSAQNKKKGRTAGKTKAKKR